MTDAPVPPFHRRLAGWRIAGWSAAAALLALPALAMRFTDEVQWDFTDFIVAGTLLLVTGLAAEVGLRLARSWPHLAGYALAIGTGFFTVWSNLAVGIIGNEGEPINLGFFAVLAAGFVVAALLRFRPRALSAVTAAMALAQPLLGITALRAMPGHAVEWGVLGMFALLWLAASLAFRHHAHTSETAA